MLKTQFVFSLLCLTLAFSAQAQTLPFNELRFANRAQCAIDAEQPTLSAFVVLDGYNAGRVASNLAKNLSLEPEATAKAAMTEFRLSAASLSQLILKKLSTGQLPLLPTNIDESQKVSLKRYQQIALGCQNNVFCPGLRAYIQTLWTQSATPAKDRLAVLKPLDNFQRTHLLNMPASPSCLHLKKFSPLQAPLHTTGVTAAQLNAIAETALNSSKFVTACDSTDAEIDPRNVAIQLDIPATDLKAWNLVGYDFWNSYKIYLSWAWRYAPELKNTAPQFHSILRSLDFEESFLMMSNGCKSITLPQCDNQTLAVNAIRELAKKTGTLTEFDELVPKGPDQQIIDRGARAVNNDFLETLSYEKAEQWVANFRKNFVETRWIMKNKVFNANQTMSTIAANFTPEELTARIQEMLLEPGVSDQVRDEAAYMCLEWRLSADEKLDFLKTDIERVAQLETMAEVNSSVGLPIEQQIGLYQRMSAALEPVCESLEQGEFFRKDEYKTNWSGLEAWAKELTNASLPQDPAAMTFVPQINDGEALLTVGTPMTVICANGMDCARKIFKSAVDLYTASTYAEAFLPVSSTGLSADVFNPYAELKACKVYDPWFQTNRIRKIFIADLVNTALVGWNPIPLYLDVDFSAPKVTSFNQLLKDGKIQFDPNIQKSKLMAAVIADFGPLLGSPCAVQLSPSADKAFDFYAFSGVSVNYCNVKAQRGGTADRPGDVKISTPKDSSVCAGCTLNFMGVSSGAASITSASGFNPLKFGVYLFRAVHRFFKGMKDKTNIPNTYTIRIDRVVEAYQRYNGQIPETCIESLSQGYKCYQDLCASKLADTIETDWKIAPTKVTYREESGRRGAGDQRKIATVYFKQCDGNVTIPFSCHKRTGSRWYADLQSAEGTASCRKYVRGLK